METSKSFSVQHIVAKPSRLTWPDQKAFTPEPGRVYVLQRSGSMAKPNFKFQKRQKELEKKKKNEEKMQRKMDKNSSQPPENNADSPTDEENQE
jgi:hypothetical protein